MNIWKWILFYFYSGIALGGIAGRIMVDCESENEVDAELPKYALIAMKLGNYMADATSNSIQNGYDQMVIAAYEAKVQKLAELSRTEPVNKLGA